MDVDDHACDTVLALGLGCGGARPTNPCRQPPSPPLEPSLTLSLSDEIYGPPAISKAADDQVSGARAKRRLSSPHSSTVSSLSTSTNIKKERVDFLGGSDEAEVERDSYRASDEEAEDALAARKKLRLTKEQSALLEDRFKEHSSLNPKQKQALANQLNLQPRQVEVWFQNRRARTKLKQTEVDCEFLRRCCETLTEENRRLQKEVQMLKKFAAPPPPAPLFMQLPAATLTLCPSCERISEAGVSAVNKADSIDGGGMFMKAAKARHFFNPFTHSAAC